MTVNVFIFHPDGRLVILSSELTEGKASSKNVSLTSAFFWTWSSFTSLTSFARLLSLILKEWKVSGYFLLPVCRGRIAKLPLVKHCWHEHLLGE